MLGFRGGSAGGVVCPLPSANLLSLLSIPAPPPHYPAKVRVLESERAFERLELTQTSMYDALAFSTFLNAALIMSTTLAAGSPLLPVRVAWTLAGVFGLRIPLGLLKVCTHLVVVDALGAAGPAVVVVLFCFVSIRTGLSGLAS